MAMTNDIQSFAAYSAAAAARWKLRADLPNTSDAEPLSPSCHDHPCEDPRQHAQPKRDAEVSEAMSAHGAKCEERWRAERLMHASRGLRQRGGVTGRGKPRGQLHFDVRGERWESGEWRARAYGNGTRVIGRTARLGTVRCLDADPEARKCGIPAFVRGEWAARCEAMQRQARADQATAPVMPSAVGECEEAAQRIETAEQVSAAAVHALRARSSFKAGDKCLKSHARLRHVRLADGSVLRCEGPVQQDTYADVLKRYTGKPDELYRRKVARRFATWRRTRLVQESEERRIVADAEREMKRRRGHDLLLSERKAGESSFAPFLFDNSNNAFAYSTKISAKKALRESMLEKYTSAAPDEEISSRDRAEEVAHTKELFHTRVMNRFA